MELKIGPRQGRKRATLLADKRRLFSTEDFTLPTGDTLKEFSEDTKLHEVPNFINEPGVWLFAIHPDHAFIIESDGKNQFKIFQSFSLLYSFYYWVGEPGEELCGLYNSGVKQKGRSPIDMHSVERARHRYGRNQVICGFKEFVIDLIATIDLAKHIFRNRGSGIDELMFANDLKHLPSMSYIFGGSVINYHKLLDNERTNIKTRVHFRRYLG